MTLDYILANPAGNITALVTTAVDRSAYSTIAQNIMKTSTQATIEQVAFVTPPLYGGAVRIEMMGMEFCGNATRSAGMIFAPDIDGTQQIMVECSGSYAPVKVTVNGAKKTAFVEMPLPSKLESIPCGQFGELGVVWFEGIVHVIALDITPSVDHFHRIASLLPEETNEHALGMMFYDGTTLTPYVYVEGTNSLVLEGSCGSGSSALACWLSQTSHQSQSYEFTQPSGKLAVSVTYQNNQRTTLSMGGEVEFAPATTITI